MPHGAPRSQPHPSTLRQRPPSRQSARSLCLRAGSGSGVRACAEEPARGAQGLVPKWRSVATASPSPPSGAGAGLAVGSWVEVGGLSGQRENGAQPERSGLPAAARKDRGGALQSHRACERWGAAGAPPGQECRAWGGRRGSGARGGHAAAQRLHQGRQGGSTWCLSLASGPCAGAACVSSLL